MKEKIKHISRRLLSLLMVLCMVIGLFPAMMTTTAEAADTDGLYDHSSKSTTRSYKTASGGAWDLTMTSTTNKTGAPDNQLMRVHVNVTTTGNFQFGIYESEFDSDGNYCWESQYQYGEGSNGFLSATATAEVADSSADVLDEAHWKTPGIEFGSGSLYTQSGSITNATNNQTGRLFGTVTAVYTEDLISNRSGLSSGAGDGADVIGIEGTAYGQPDLKITLRIKLMLNKNTDPQEVNMCRCTVEAYNASETQAYDFGVAWGQDSYAGKSGFSVTGPDATIYRGAEVEPFQVGTVWVEFPTGGKSKVEAAVGTAFQTTIPQYLMSTDPGTDRNQFTMLFYPGMSGVTDSSYGIASVGQADYVGMAQYYIVYKSYFFKITGDGTPTSGSNNDSGMIVRYNPRLFLPQQYQYFGFDIGGTGGSTVISGEPGINVMGTPSELDRNTQHTGYQTSVNPSLNYLNDADISFDSAKLRITLNPNHLEPDESMTGDGGWVKNTALSTDTAEVWELDLGSLAADTGEKPAIPGVNLNGIPQYEGDVTTTVTFELVLNGEVMTDSYENVRVEKQITLPKCESLTLNGTVWRDINGDNDRADFEGVMDVPVELWQDEDWTLDTAETDITFEVLDQETKSLGGGVVNGPQGVQKGKLQAITIGDLTNTVNERYTLGNAKITVTPTDGSAAKTYELRDREGNLNEDAIIELGESDDYFDLLRIGDVNGNGRPAIIYMLKDGMPGAAITFEFELREKAVVKVNAYDGTTTGRPGVCGGSYWVAVNGVETLRDSMDEDESSIQFETPARDTITVSYSTPMGWRHQQGRTITAEKTVSNLRQWYDPTNPDEGRINDVDFPLIRGDLRLTGATSTEDETITQTAIQNGDTAELILGAGRFSGGLTGLTAKLDFSVWDSQGNETQNPEDRNSYVWTYTNVDGQTNPLSSTEEGGIVTFSGDAGAVDVTISKNGMSHTMRITVQPTHDAGAYTELYLAEVTPSYPWLENTSVTVNGNQKVYIYGKTAGGSWERISNTVSGSVLSFQYYDENGTLIDGEDSLCFTVERAQGQGDSYLWAIEGDRVGYGSVKPVYGDTVGKTTDVLVTTSGISRGTLEIWQDNAKAEEIQDQRGQTVAVQYVLRYGNGNNYDVLPAAAVTAELETGTNTEGSSEAVASFADGNINNISLDHVGRTYLNATLKADTSKTARALVRATSGNTTLEGNQTLCIQETTTTGGILRINDTFANYRVFIDTDEDKLYTNGVDQAVLAGELTWTQEKVSGELGAGGTVTTSLISEAAYADRTRVTGDEEGLVKLTATYGENSVSVYVLVHSEDRTYEGLTVEPAASAMYVNSEKTLAVKAVLSDGTKVTLHESMYTAQVDGGGKIGLKSAAEADRSTVVSNTQIGEGIYTAKNNRPNHNTATAEILVVPTDVKLSVTPSPVVVHADSNADDNTQKLSYKLASESNPDDVAAIDQTTLVKYIAAHVNNPSKATLSSVSEDSVTQHQITGKQVGKTELDAQLNGLNDTAISSNVYVYCQMGIGVNPRSMELENGESGTAQFYLLNQSGVFTDAIDLADLQVTSEDEDIAQYQKPDFDDETADRTKLTVTGMGTDGESTNIVGKLIEGVSVSMPVLIGNGTVQTVNGIEALPTVIELWPGEEKEIVIRDSLTHETVSRAIMDEIHKVFPIATEDQNQFEVKTNDAGQLVLVLSQTEDTVAGINTLELSYQGSGANITILNFTENPYDGNHTMNLSVDPEIQTVDLNGHKDVKVNLELYNDSTGESVESIILPGKLLSSTPNTDSSLPGQVVIQSSDNSGESLQLTGSRAGVTAYTTAYTNEQGEMIRAEAHAVVLSGGEANVDYFRFNPNPLVVNKGEYGLLQGVIHYSNGTEQNVSSVELPYVIQNLSVVDQEIASVNSTGTVRGLSAPDNGESETRVTGNLITGGSAQGTIRVLGSSVQEYTVTYSVTGDAPTTASTVPAMETYLEDQRVTVKGKLTYNSDTETAKADGTSGSWIFHGWYTDPDDPNTEVAGIDSIQADTVLYGYWTFEANKWGVTYAVDMESVPYGYTGTVDENSYDDNRDVTLLPVPTTSEEKDQSGTPGSWEFKGWYSSDTYSEEDKITTIEHIDGNKTVYGKWVFTPTTYTVTYRDSEAATATEYEDPTEYSYQSSVTLKTAGELNFAAPAGMVFAYWKDEDGNEYTDEVQEIEKNLVLTAQWKTDDTPATYTVTYKANNGTADADISVAFEEGAAVAAKPADTFTPPNGMVFLSWYDAQTGNSYAADASLPSDNDLTLYARWGNASQAKHTLTYHIIGTNYGTSWNIDPVTANADESITLETHEDVTVTGGVQKFDGWYSSESDMNAGSNRLTSPITLTGDMDVYGKWTFTADSPVTTTYKLTYHVIGTDYGTSWNIDPVTANADESITLETHEDVTVTGGVQKFDGWYSSESDMNAGSSKLTSPITLTGDMDVYGKWTFVADENPPTPQTYTVTYKDADGTVVATETVTEGDTTTVKDPSDINDLTIPEGQEINYWNGKGGPYHPGDSIEPTNNLELTVVWKDVTPETTKYTLTYNLVDDNKPDGWTVPAAKTENKGTTVQLETAADVITTTGTWTFSGWYKNQSDVGTSAAALTSVTLNADTDVYGKWTFKVKQCTVTYTDPTGTATQVTRTEDAGPVTIEGASVFTSIPTNKELDYWKGSDGHNYAPGETYQITNDVTLTAEWKNTGEQSSQYTVTYTDPSDSNNQKTEQHDMGEQTTAKKPEDVGFTVPDGKKFESWTGSDGKTYHEGDVLPADGNLTLEVVWQDKTYTVTYYANNGTGNSATESYTSSTVTAKSGSTFAAPSGKTFSSWNTAANGTGTTYQPGQTLPSGNLALYAQWKNTDSGTSEGGSSSGGSSHSGGGSSGALDRYTLTYESNGGTEYDSEKYTEGSTVKLDKRPSRSGYIFTGWYSDEELSDKITRVSMNGNKTVYAGWEKEELHIPASLNGDDHFAYVSGYPDGTVQPQKNITRAEVAMIFYRLLNDDVRTANETSSCTFADVTADKWYNTAISTIARAGIVAGRSAQEFDPEAPITRAEFATICAQFDQSGKQSGVSFSDIDNSWAESYIERAAALGWVSGYEDGTFRPNNSITRAEAMCMINRVLGRLPETEDDLLDGMKTWPDNSDTGAWYYFQVQEATNGHTFDRKADGVHESWTGLLSR